MKPEDLQTILDTHDQYWGDKRTDMLRYKAVYEMDFWEDINANAESQIRIQTNEEESEHYQSLPSQQQK